MGRTPINEAGDGESQGDSTETSTATEHQSEIASTMGTRRGTIKRIASISTLSSVILGSAGANALQPVRASSFSNDPKAYESYWEKLVEQYGDISSVQVATKTTNGEIHDEKGILDSFDRSISDISQRKGSVVQVQQIEFSNGNTEYEIRRKPDPETIVISTGGREWRWSTAKVDKILRERKGNLNIRPRPVESPGKYQPEETQQSDSISSSGSLQPNGYIAHKAFNEKIESGDDALGSNHYKNVTGEAGTPYSVVEAEAYAAIAGGAGANVDIHKNIHSSDWSMWDFEFECEYSARGTDIVAADASVFLDIYVSAPDEMWMATPVEWTSTAVGDIWSDSGSFSMSGTVPNAGEGTARCGIVANVSAVSIGPSSVEVSVGRSLSGHDYYMLDTFSMWA